MRGRIEVIGKKGRGLLVESDGREYAVGRDGALGLDHDDEISRRHFHIVYVGGAFRLQDEGSANGTWVDGVRVDERLLRGGERIRIGSANLRFVVEAVPPPIPATAPPIPATAPPIPATPPPIPATPPPIPRAVIESCRHPTEIAELRHQLETERAAHTAEVEAVRRSAGRELQQRNALITERDAEIERLRGASRKAGDAAEDGRLQVEASREILHAIRVAVGPHADSDDLAVSVRAVVGRLQLREQRVETLSRQLELAQARELSAQKDRDEARTSHAPCQPLRRELERKLTEAEAARDRLSADHADLERAHEELQASVCSREAYQQLREIAAVAKHNLTAAKTPLDRALDAIELLAVKRSYNFDDLNHAYQTVKSAVDEVRKDYGDSLSHLDRVLEIRY